MLQLNGELKLFGDNADTLLAQAPIGIDLNDVVEFKLSGEALVLRQSSGDVHVITLNTLFDPTLNGLTLNGSDKVSGFYINEVGILTLMNSGQIFVWGDNVTQDHADLTGSIATKKIVVTSDAFAIVREDNAIESVGTDYFDGYSMAAQTALKNLLPLPNGFLSLYQDGSAYIDGDARYTMSLSTNKLENNQYYQPHVDFEFSDVELGSGMVENGGTVAETMWLDVKI